VVNFPRLKLSTKTLRIFFGLLILIIAIRFGVKASLFSSIVISSLIILLSIVLRGVWRGVKYNRFLCQIGAPISRATFHEGENSMSVVPFNNKPVACSARIDNTTLMFGRAKIYRAVQLNSIENIEFENYFGHQVARLTLSLEESEKQVFFYIPWSDLLQNEVEVCEST